MPDLLQKALKKEQAQEVHVPNSDPTIVPEDVDSESAHDVAHPETSLPDVRSSVTKTNFWTNREAHPVVMNIILQQKYELEWMIWEPETIALHIKEDFNSTLSDVNMSKIMALRSLQLVDSFWERWEVFNICTSGLNGLAVTEVVSVPTVLQCMIAVDMAQRIRSDLEYTKEIERWLSAVHRMDQICVPLPPLEFVQVDTTGYPVDIQYIKAQWPIVRRTRRIPSEITVENNQLLRMLELHLGLLESQEELQHQLRLIQ